MLTGWALGRWFGPFVDKSALGTFPFDGFITFVNSIFFQHIQASLVSVTVVFF
jgi:hypothetical protein